MLSNPTWLPVVVLYQQSGTGVLTVQVYNVYQIKACQLKPQWHGEGDMAIQPNGINHKAANLAILSYQVDLHTTYSVE